MWDNIHSVETIARLATWIGAALAFIAALTGVVRIAADNRAKTLTAEFKKTQPLLDAELKLIDNDKFHIIIECKNLIPFEHKAIIQTQNKRILGGFPMGWETIYPSPDKKRFVYRRTADVGKIIDNDITLIFQYHSVYAREQDLPEGKIVKKYILSVDKKEIKKVID